MSHITIKTAGGFTKQAKTFQADRNGHADAAQAIEWLAAEVLPESTAVMCSPCAWGGDRPLEHRVGPPPAKPLTQGLLAAQTAAGRRMANTGAYGARSSR